MLGKNLKFMEHSSIVSVQISNAEEFKHIKAVMIEYETSSDGSGVVHSADFSEVNQLGIFSFFVLSPNHQYALAYSDQNQNDQYDTGEPAWISTDQKGKPAAVMFDPKTDKAKFTGSLSRSTILPEFFKNALTRFKQDRSRDEVISKLSIPVALGDIAHLDEPRFSTLHGEDVVWEPIDFPLHSGIGIYFLEKYDPSKTPVLFVYGASGSPQDWRVFFEKMDRKKYQPWFFNYPTGRRLDEMATALNIAVSTLQDHYKFNRMHVVAHSMGGMVARSFVIKNVLEDHHDYIKNLVTISTPWHGHKAAELGVKRSPKVVPSWRDMVQGSPFQQSLYSHKLKGKVPHLLIYGDLAKNSPILPDENDGTVSVASETFAPIFSDATRTQVFHASHVGILSRRDVIRLVDEFLSQ